MVDPVSISANKLPLDTSFDSFSEVSDLTLQNIVDLQGEAKSITSSIVSNGMKVEGPARNGTLALESMFESFEKSTQMSVHLHENMTQFAVLSTTLTSFGNNLNSFLKGQ